MKMETANGETHFEGSSGQSLSISPSNDNTTDQKTVLNGAHGGPSNSPVTTPSQGTTVEVLTSTSMEPPNRIITKQTHSRSSDHHNTSVGGLSKGIAKSHSANITPFNSDDAAAAQSGEYFFPAEQSPHRATILAYPSYNSLPADLVEPVRAEISELANTIACFEPVRLFVRPEDMDKARAQVLRHIDDPSHITFHPMHVNHCWVRDTGPVYVHSTGPDRHRYAIQFGFDEWGGKAPVSAADGEEQLVWGLDWPVLSKVELAENTVFASRVIDADEPKVLRLNAELGAEGGGLIVDGEGTLIITESCMLCDVRNPGWSKAKIEGELRRLLGVEKIIWFKGARNYDITDCHVDAVARFVRPGVIVMSRPHDTQPRIWIDVYEEALEILKRETDAKGRPFEIITMHEPDITPLVRGPENEIVTSYVNYYHVNSGVIAPKFGDEEMDRRALETLKALYPTREVKQVFLNALPIAGGGIHCVTQQVPFSKMQDTWVEELHRRSIATAKHMAKAMSA
ncbi:agmatine deiminase [Physcia stellaris]|nr:agmatine deiminase [Physcia stellaris]